MPKTYRWAYFRRKLAEEEGLAPDLIAYPNNSTVMIINVFNSLTKY